DRQGLLGRGDERHPLHRDPVREPVRGVRRRDLHQAEHRGLNRAARPREGDTMKFLLVDDSKTMRNIQKKVLSSMAGAEFAEAGDGVEALAVIQATSGGFDLIMVDWNMPNMDGLALVKKVRETDKKTLMVMATTEAEKSRVL